MILIEIITMAYEFLQQNLFGCDWQYYYVWEEDKSEVLKIWQSLFQIKIGWNFLKYNRWVKRLFLTDYQWQEERDSMWDDKLFIKEIVSTVLEVLTSLYLRRSDLRVYLRDVPIRASKVKKSATVPFARVGKVIGSGGGLLDSAGSVRGEGC